MRVAVLVLVVILQSVLVFAMHEEIRALRSQRDRALTACDASQ